MDRLPSARSDTSRGGGRSADDKLDQGDDNFARRRPHIWGDRCPLASILAIP